MHKVDALVMQEKQDRYEEAYSMYVYSENMLCKYLKTNVISLNM